MTQERKVTLSVNGQPRSAYVDPWMTLADMLRDVFHLTGTRIGCAEGVCGSCTILVDGETVRSCLTLAAQAQDCAVVTIEGYADVPEARAIQQAFIDHFAAQCGFCTSGMIATVRSFLADTRIADHGDETEIRKALNANACRCTGYQAIVSAVKALAGHTEARAHG